MAEEGGGSSNTAIVAIVVLLIIIVFVILFVGIGPVGPIIKETKVQKEVIQEPSNGSSFESQTDINILPESSSENSQNK